MPFMVLKRLQSLSAFSFLVVCLSVTAYLFFLYNFKNYYYNSMDFYSNIAERVQRNLSIFKLLFCIPKKMFVVVNFKLSFLMRFKISKIIIYFTVRNLGCLTHILKIRRIGVIVRFFTEDPKSFDAILFYQPSNHKITL